MAQLRSPSKSTYVTRSGGERTAVSDSLGRRKGRASSPSSKQFTQLAIVLWPSPRSHFRLFVRALPRHRRHLGVGLGGLPSLGPRRDVGGLRLVALPVLVGVVRLQGADPLAAVKVVRQQVLADVVHAAYVDNRRHPAPPSCVCVCVPLSLPLSLAALSL